MLTNTSKIYDEGDSYLKSLEKTLTVKSKFSNDLLYQMAVISLEKFFVSLLSHYNENAIHHTPKALLAQVSNLMPIPTSIKETTALIDEFESICFLSGFGYKKPTDEQLQQMIRGLLEIRSFVLMQCTKTPLTA